jgi:hypothetical protein
VSLSTQVLGGVGPEAPVCATQAMEADTDSSVVNERKRMAVASPLDVGIT